MPTRKHDPLTGTDWLLIISASLYGATGVALIALRLAGIV